MLGSYQDTIVSDLLAKGERIDIEFKTAQNALTKDVFSTICAFNNRFGGHLLLGVSDGGEVVGVNPDKVDKILKDLATTINNPNKFYPPLYLRPQIHTVGSKIVIHIYVPNGTDVCRLNNRYYDRSHEGDIDVSQNSTLIFNLFRRKHEYKFVDAVVPHLGIESLDHDSLEKAKALAFARGGRSHSWSTMTYEEMLRSVNLIGNDPESQKEGLTLAAILLFGKENTILSVLPQHRTDAILRIQNMDRYDDRDLVCVNLIESYYRLMDFGRKHLSNLFVLEGDVRVSARDRILREVITNTLAHRDYSSNFPAKFVIGNEQILIENSSVPHSDVAISASGFSPFQKNPLISRVFREIGLAEELGSGIRNALKYTRLYSQSEPIFEDGDIFRTYIPLPQVATYKVGAHPTKPVMHDALDVFGTSSIDNSFAGLDAPNSKNSRLQGLMKMEELILENDKISRKEIAEKLGVSEKTVSRWVKDSPRIQFIGKGRTGRWALMNTN